MTKEFELLCPVCGGVQYCPCQSCRERNGEQITWQWDELGVKSSCGYCGYSSSTDQWLDEQHRQFEEWKRVQKGKEVSNYTPGDQEDDGYPD
jgi:hypothetical protein